MSAKRVRQKPGKDPEPQDKQAAIDPQLRDFGARLRDARQATGLTIRDVEKATGIDKTDISRIERGLINPSYTRIQKLAFAVNMSIELMPNVSPPTPKKT